MKSFAAMDTTKLIGTKAYTAYYKALMAKQPPTKILNNLMWRSKKALELSFTFKPDLFTSRSLDNEIPLNPELQASLLCIDHLLEDKSAAGADPLKEIPTVDQSRTLSPMAHAEEIQATYKELGSALVSRLKTHQDSRLNNGNFDNAAQMHAALESAGNPSEKSISNEFSEGAKDASEKTGDLKEKIDKLYLEKDSQPEFHTEVQRIVLPQKEFTKSSEKKPQGRSEHYYKKSQRGFETR